MEKPSAAFAVLASLALAQAPPATPQTEGEVAQAAIQTLLGFARTAEGYKDGARAKAAYERILDHYDVENRTARLALGHRLDQGTWLPPTDKVKKLDQVATAANQKRVEQAWEVASRKLCALHRDFGLSRQAADDLVRGIHHLELAIAYDPGDRAAHQALGHGEHDGLFGNGEQIAFLQRAQAIRARATELAATAYDVEPLSAGDLPAPLPALGLPFAGARTEHFAVWLQGQPHEAAAMAQQAERALALVQFVVPSEATRAPHRMRSIRWIVRLRRVEDRNRLTRLQPRVFKQSAAELERWSALSATIGGQPSYVSYGDAMGDADWVTSLVARTTFSNGRNDALGEGFVHAMTWLLCGTTLTWYGSLPPTESSGGAPLGFDPDHWRKRLLEEIAAGRDWPLDQLPRERLSHFRPQVRTKAWSFVLWLLARHPERLPALAASFPRDAIPLPEDCAEVYRKVMEVSVGELQEEWRAWMLGATPLLRAARL